MATVVGIVVASRRWCRYGPILLVLAFITPALVSAQPALQFTITDLGTLGGDYINSYAVDINDQGIIVGYSATSNLEKMRAVAWQNGGMADLGTLGGDHSIATGLNDRGQIVGISAVTVGGPEHAFMWQNGVMTDLGTLGGDVSSATGINEQGQIAGASTTVDGHTHAFVWQNGRMTDLGTLGGDLSAATEINEHGQIAGFSSMTGTYPRHAFVWQDGVMTDLGTLHGDDSFATSINDTGQVVGDGFMWQNGVMTAIEFFAFDINNQGQIVGDGGHAMFWQNGVRTDLGTLGDAYDYSIGSSINERGQIAGVSVNTHGMDAEYRATLWTIKAATPEEQIAVLKAQVDDLLTSGVLNQGQHQALSTKLDGALRKLAQHNTQAAANQLRAFVNQVDAFEQGRILSASQAQSLRDAASAIIADLTR